MTVSRTKLPKGFAELAGQRFGINLLDLFGADEEGSYENNGFLPQFSTTVTEKGRGGVLGYKAPKMPTRQSTFEIVPQLPGQGSASVNIANNNNFTPVSAPAPIKEPEKPVVPQRESLGSIASKFGQTALFGGQDYFKALEAGYKPEEVRSYIEMNPGMVHETNRPGQTGGLYEQIARGNVTQPTEYFTPQQFLDRQVQQQQSQPAPQPAPAPKPSTPNFSIQYGESDAYLGGKDVDAAKAGGASDREIAQWINANQDKLRGGNVPGGGGLYDQYKQYL